MVLSIDEVTNACIDLVTIEGRLFTLLNSTPFRALVEPIFSGLGMNVINSHSIVNIIDEISENLKKQITHPCSK
ncbi:hypothetical protein QLX08_002748 [Tetragonisca angustula]|uniref:Uncharacterized protein n=1 Tax=Tetragonisca angustula TaxID=166442 RepID=A0AAW1ACS8_9HYME